jgi:hypothetical protein
MKILIFIFCLKLLKYTNMMNLNEICNKYDYSEYKNIYKNLKIFTLSEFYIDIDDDYLDEEILIFENCKSEKNWNFHMKSNFYEFNQKIFENEDIPRRSFTIKNKNQEPNQPIQKEIVLNSISLVENTNVVIVSSKLPFELSPGSSFDFFIEYNCEEQQKDYINIIIKLTFNDEVDYDFGYQKICSKNRMIYSNVTYFLLILMFVILSYFCEQDYLTFNVHIVKINLNDILKLQYAEYITLYTLIFVFVLVLLGILTLFKAFAYISGVLLSLISIKFVLKSLISLFRPDFNQIITNKIWTMNSNYNITVSLSKIVYYLISILIFSIWMIYFNNFLLMNFIAFSISYLVIKKFYFHNFGIIIFLFLTIIFYNSIWLLFNRISFIDTFNLSSENIVNIPIRFFLPELFESPFQTNYFFSLLDLILIGFLFEYLKLTSVNLAKDYLTTTRYTIYFGLLINLCAFYFFKVCMPFFIFPGSMSIIYAIWLATRNGEFLIFLSLVAQENHFRSKINKNFPLQIIGADVSQDYLEYLAANKKYVPPNIISEIDCIREESPKDKPFLSRIPEDENSLYK